MEREIILITEGNGLRLAKDQEQAIASVMSMEDLLLQPQSASPYLDFKYFS